ncbi:uncharacterized protein C8Q71DRAFT_861475 [Rhodofomes roseus]|uniref:Uncharacterized protein n=1 Tax=Rhodofomes roseus TaxID=34475 RepID=A0ABQ8K4F4_9APHY|nr:uncharacterized protein C8Q71DRAFT_861475 [Rhodofomes roseus]KAH9831799.1 hypothetical protein C8Q71DRAFT_861475 [Rhodofomes roseus]
MHATFLSSLHHTWASLTSIEDNNKTEVRPQATPRWTPHDGAAHHRSSTLPLPPSRRRGERDRDVRAPLKRMRIDVELCGQLLVMYRHEQHLVNVAASLPALRERLLRKNTQLRTDPRV